MDSIILTSPPLLALCAVAIVLHIVEYLLGGRRWLSAINLVYHLLAIVAFLFLEANLADILIFLMLSCAVCLALRLRRSRK